MAQWPRQGSVLSPLRLKVFFAAILFVAVSRFSKGADILADLVHLQQQPWKVAPETALECVRRAIWRMLYTDDACIVSWSPRGLGRMMAVFVEIFGTSGLTISEGNTETICMPTSRAPATKIVFNVTGQQYRRTTSFTYLGATVTDTPNLSDEIDRLQALHAGAIRRPEGTSAALEGPDGEVQGRKDSLIRMRVMELLRGHYTKLRTTHHKMLLRILRAWCASRRTNVSSLTTPSSKSNARASKQPCARGGCCDRECAAPHGGPKVTQEGRIGRGGERAKTWAGGEGEIMDGLRGRGLSAIWHRGGLEHRRK